jgi:hypothetical protein
VKKHGGHSTSNDRQIRPTPAECEKLVRLGFREFANLPSLAGTKDVKKKRLDPAQDQNTAKRPRHEGQEDNTALADALQRSQEEVKWLREQLDAARRAEHEATTQMRRELEDIRAILKAQVSNPPKISVQASDPRGTKRKDAPAKEANPDVKMTEGQHPSAAAREEELDVDTALANEAKEPDVDVALAEEKKARKEEESACEEKEESSAKTSVGKSPVDSGEVSNSVALPSSLVAGKVLGNVLESATEQPEDETL